MSIQIHDEFFCICLRVYSRWMIVFNSLAALASFIFSSHVVLPFVSSSQSSSSFIFNYRNKLINKHSFFVAIVGVVVVVDVVSLSSRCRSSLAIGLCPCQENCWIISRMEKRTRHRMDGCRARLPPPFVQLSFIVSFVQSFSTLSLSLSISPFGIRVCVCISCRSGTLYFVLYYFISHFRLQLLMETRCEMRWHIFTQ